MSSRAGTNPNMTRLALTSPQITATATRWRKSGFDYVQKLWREDKPFDWQGNFYKGKGVYSLPHPAQSSVPVLNAAASEEGRAFAMRNADFLFTPVF